MTPFGTITQESKTKPLHSSWDILQVRLWTHDDVIKWKHFPHYWPFVQGIHQSLVNSPHKGQWCRALMFSLFCTWINSCVNNREASDLKHHPAHYDVNVMHEDIPWLILTIGHHRHGSVVRFFFRKLTILSYKPQQSTTKCEPGAALLRCTVIWNAHL